MLPGMRNFLALFLVLSLSGCDGARTAAQKAIKDAAPVMDRAKATAEIVRELSDKALNSTTYVCQLLPDTRNAAAASELGQLAARCADVKSKLRELNDLAAQVEKGVRTAESVRQLLDQALEMAFYLRKDIERFVSRSIAQR